MSNWPQKACAGACHGFFFALLLLMQRSSVAGSATESPDATIKPAAWDDVLRQDLESGHQLFFPDKAVELIFRYSNNTVPPETLKKHAQHVSEVLREDLKAEAYAFSSRSKNRTEIKDMMQKALLSECEYIPAPLNERQLCCSLGDMFYCLPNFIIIGAQKSGTTALYAYLMHHSNVKYANNKELHFFDFSQRWNSGLKHYLTQFDNHGSKAHASTFVTGEASPSYMAMNGVCRRIRQLLPHTKILAVLRDPVKRAWSEFQMSVRINRVHDELKARLKTHMKQLRECLEEGMFEKPVAKNETRRETLLRVKYVTMDLSDCMPDDVSELQQWQIFLSGLIRQSSASPEWQSCWELLKAAPPTEAWNERWDICTRQLLSRTTEQHQRFSGDESTVFQDRLYRDAKKINNCKKLPEYENNFLGCNKNAFPSDLTSDYIWRGLFAEQLKECYRWFPRNQILVLEQDDLRKAPIATLARVMKFLNLPEFDYRQISAKRAMDLFNEVYPSFEATTGWKAKELYQGIPSLSEEFLVEFFTPHNEELFSLLGKRYHKWSHEKQVPFGDSFVIEEF